MVSRAANLAALGRHDFRTPRISLQGRQGVDKARRRTYDDCHPYGRTTYFICYILLDSAPYRPST